jgi:hypothetical protein
MDGAIGDLCGMPHGGYAAGLPLQLPPLSVGHRGLFLLLIWGLIYAAIFRLTSNLLIVWPFVWSVASSIGTLMGGMEFTWKQVAIWSVILLLQLGSIGYTWRGQGGRIG